MVVSDIIALVAIIVSFFGVFYTRVQIHQAQIAQRGVLFKDLYQRLFEDQDFNYVYQLTEMRQPIFSPGYGALDPVEKMRRERAIERLFAHLEIICALYKNNLLTIEEMQHFRYNIQRLSQYPNFNRYRHSVEVLWPQARKLERGPYSSVFWYVDKYLKAKQN